MEDLTLCNIFTSVITKNRPIATATTTPVFLSAHFLLRELYIFIIIYHIFCPVTINVAKRIDIFCFFSYNFRK